MVCEHIIKRNDGKIKITVRVSVDNWSRINNKYYSIEVQHLPKGKRKWLDCLDTDCYRYRSSKNRDEFAMNEYLKYVSHDEIYQAKLKAWEEIKPIK